MFDLKRPVWPTFKEFCRREKKADQDLVKAVNDSFKRLGVNAKVAGTGTPTLQINQRKRIPYLFVGVTPYSLLSIPDIVMAYNVDEAMERAREKSQNKYRVPISDDQLDIYLFAPINLQESQEDDPMVKWIELHCHKPKPSIALWICTFQGHINLAWYLGGRFWPYGGRIHDGRKPFGDKFGDCDVSHWALAQLPEEPNLPESQE